jgi:hypothetical protein
VLYESVRPFLKTIQEIEPLRVPLQEYLVHGDLAGRHINLPKYATRDGFTWDLSALLKPDSLVTTCSFDPRNTLSIACARQVMYDHGNLDPG